MYTHTHTHTHTPRGSKMHGHKLMVAACLQTMLPMQADVNKLSGVQYSDKRSSADAFKAITHNAVHQHG